VSQRTICGRWGREIKGNGRHLWLTTLGSHRLCVSGEDFEVFGFFLRPKSQGSFSRLLNRKYKIKPSHAVEAMLSDGFPATTESLLALLSNTGRYDVDSKARRFSSVSLHCAASAAFRWDIYGLTPLCDTSISKYIPAIPNALFLKSLSKTVRTGAKT
jgi:hypothetical protein